MEFQNSLSVIDYAYIVSVDGTELLPILIDCLSCVSNIHSDNHNSFGLVLDVPLIVTYAPNLLL